MKPKETHHLFALTFLLISVILVFVTIFFPYPTARLAAAAVGSGYEIGWWTVDGGGYETLESNDYSLFGTIGQPDAGRLSEGGYRLIGGYWPVILPTDVIFLPLILR